MGDNVCSDVFQQFAEQIKKQEAYYSKYSKEHLWQLSDPTDPKTVFDFTEFMKWLSNDLIPNYTKRDEEGLLRITDEIVFYMNYSNCFVNGSKPCYYILKPHWIYRDQNYWCPVSEEDFKKTYKVYSLKLPQSVEKPNKDGTVTTTIKLVSTDLSKIYTKSAMRRQHQDAIFDPFSDPTDKFSPEHLNKWMGYRYSIKQMEESINDPVAVDTCIEFLKYVYHIHCAGSALIFRYLIDWFAIKMRNPGLKMSTALCFFSKRQRVGKGWTVNVFGHLFGQHFAQTNNQVDVTGRFTTFQDDTVILFLDEVRTRIFLPRQRDPDVVLAILRNGRIVPDP